MNDDTSIAKEIMELKKNIKELKLRLDEFEMFFDPDKGNIGGRIWALEKEIFPNHPQFERCDNCEEYIFACKCE
tara:strand:+ start:136 stop:357 length:222 start_codon:yes stop_codon:yes gene_type:complete